MYFSLHPLHFIQLAIYDDIDNTQFRTKAVEIFYNLLKRKNSPTIPKPLLKIALKVTDVAIMASHSSPSNHCTNYLT
jgi:hypothetical protein